MAITEHPDEFSLRLPMETFGEPFTVYRGDVTFQAKGIPNREKATNRRYIGFEPETDVRPGDRVVGQTSLNEFWIEEVEGQVLGGKLRQRKAYCIKRAPDQEHPSAEPLSAETSPGDKTRVFVVHGRNDRARRAMFEFLRSIDLKPIEWSDAIAMTGSASPYVGQVLDKAFSQAQAVVVLLTGDDEARLRKHLLNVDDGSAERELTPQARPNVLFEAGIALARHPERTLLVELGRTRPFSDMAGRHTVRLTNSTETRQDVASRLEVAGCPVNLSGRDWHSAGDFDGAVSGDSDQGAWPDRDSGDSIGEQQAPRLAITYEVDAPTAEVVLSVRNDGERAIVRAYGRLLSVNVNRDANSPSKREYELGWLENPGRAEISLGRGHSANLSLVENRRVDLDPSTSRRCALTLRSAGVGADPTTEDDIVNYWLWNTVEQEKPTRVVLGVRFVTEPPAARNLEYQFTISTLPPYGNIVLESAEKVGS